jgi:hypothetical protein
VPGEMLGAASLKSPRPCRLSRWAQRVFVPCVVDYRAPVAGRYGPVRQYLRLQFGYRSAIAPPIPVDLLALRATTLRDGDDELRVLVLSGRKGVRHSGCGKRVGYGWGVSASSRRASLTAPISR